MKRTRRALGNSGREPGAVPELPVEMLAYVDTALSDAIECAGADGGSVWLFDEAGYAHAIAAKGLALAFTEGSGIVAVRDAFSLPVIEQVNPLVATDLHDPDVLLSPAVREEAIRTGTRAFVACRLSGHEGETLGVLGVSYAEPREHDSRLIDFLMILARRIGNALQRAAELARAREHESALQLYRSTSSLIAAAWDSNKVLELVVERAHKLVRARSSQVLLLDDSALVPAIDSGAPVDGEEARELREALNDGETRVLHAAGQTQIVVPLVAFGEPLGVLRICDEQSQRELTESELTRLSILAAYVAVVTHGASALEDLSRQEEELRVLSERLVVVDEAERRRISGELQRLVGEQIAQIRGIMQRTRNAVDAVAIESAVDLCVQARTVVHGAAQAARALSVELHPGILDDLGLVPALRWFCSEVERSSGLDVELETPTRIDLNPKVARTVYRAAQESLNNVVAHAQARKARVHLTQSDSIVILEVSDDGAGFDFPGMEHSVELGIGILGMRERVRHLGGQLHVDSTIGEGTRIRLEVPI